MGNVLDHVHVHHDAFGLQFLLDDGGARFQVGLLQISTQTPFEARKQAVFEAHQFARRPVGGHDDLLAGLMQMVENVEEAFLCLFLARQKLHIVEHQHVHLQVKIHEALHIVVANGFNELVREFLARNVQHKPAAVVLLDEIADGLHQVRFAQAHATIQQQRIERGDARFLRHGHASRATQPVAISLNEVIECINRVQVRSVAVAFKLVQVKRAFVFFGVDVHLRVAVLRGLVGGYINDVGAVLFIALVNHHLVFQSSFRPEFRVNGFAQQVHEIVFQMFMHVQRRHLNCEDIVEEAQGNNRLKPSPEILFGHIFPDNGKAVVPYGFVILQHSCNQGFKWLLGGRFLNKDDKIDEKTTNKKINKICFPPFFLQLKKP